MTKPDTTPDPDATDVTVETQRCGCCRRLLSDCCCVADEDGALWDGDDD